ncbi:MAG: phytoene dehydrogenase, partial [Planctomycetota bacterium]|nr:phytoene dehydrogenase [Planctomycetota bacterium]
SARAVLADRLPEQQLIEMVLLPLLYYGSPRADDLDWHSFCVLFRSIFLEGLARPAGGIKSLLDILVKRYRSLGGELRMKTGVARILVEGGVARGVVLDDGAELRGERILSSAGWTETMKLCGKEVPLADVGRISFVESISVLDEFPAALGHTAATSFFCREDRCRYEEPEGPIDTRSGVISAPSNFATELPLEEGLMRLTVMARHDRWVGLPQDEYARQKERCAEEAIASAVTFVPDWRPHTVFRDIFTPRTIEHYTGHVHGAVYGSPRKHLDGETGIASLYLCGTDQGYLGVIGAMISGISMANRHALVPPRLTMSK